MSTIVVDGVTLDETSDPRVRVGNYYGHAVRSNWRTVVQGEGGKWDTITGPPHQTRTQALAAVSDVALYYFGTAADLDAYAASTMGQLELTQRANIELRRRIEDALRIANGPGSYRKAERMAAVLEGHPDTRPADRCDNPDPHPAHREFGGFMCGGRP